MKKITEATGNYLQTDLLQGRQMMKEIWVLIPNADGTSTWVWV
ncbi:hypothetical protein Palpr_2760 [Paludibacter propionicigenes WB4]|uniref:Uncharacterized protein n=1 Tax=Paludibacter propionicigenes (strain DSM 17365 / JCM 13257 / WB4) TaxID=694427 RepID=E4T846_PALPW|nr:hypothetical protein Palpr_2760 [Paludibacter propionicigenes WB4]